MTNKFNKDKWLTIGLLPIMWLLYFVFEIITGRVDSFYTLSMNLLLTIVFAFTGWIIYITSQKYSNGFTSKVVFIIFLVLMLIDQGIKLIIKLFYFDNYFEIIPKFLSFDPIINTDGSWLNARFGLGVGFSSLIILNALAVILFIEVYRYYLSKGNKDFWSDMAFLFILSGALCSLIDKTFYGGSLDFIGISNLFIADIKDIYINLGILFFIMLIYMKGYFKEEDSSTLKDDLQSVKKFFKFMKNDIFRK
ncbi:MULTISPECIES: signal peptidase II [Clostridium]|jgi:signal peptidase II|uniref:signal peptidase II n=1 Tax=Clostridium TaxID=1485 RepID=UPI0018A95B0D|nr:MULTISPECIES: signal peptidase II [Clostridium]MDB1935357.1 signal peptidase II [Clostridium tertium]MDB1939112.1 signal peptidase II [Clostridium tertium]MDB1946181.1 signal peptidase II [Clostridium tertium]MDB1953272.1 signal peptidase II [Clostridium tertium]MDB1971474.1 signal peptidase II [Clostridium tertium]